ncbi:MAG: S-formylglutathione hydrolase [Polyangiales bacterium]
MTYTVRSEQRAFGGVQGFYEHSSDVCAGPMKFGVYLPPNARDVPALYFLAGLTCTEETFAIKANAQRFAAKHGIALITPDTSPRSARFDGDDKDWDFGQGAGFYLDATQEPWSGAYRMGSYVTQELPALIERAFPVSSVRGIFGHSMGGHGALSIALKNPTLYRSVSAFAPICAPSQVPWGEKVFSRYLRQRDEWSAYDTVELLATHKHPGTLLVDQGTSDKFLRDQLRPELLEAACKKSGQSLQLRMREGYDHSYYFIQSFVEEHLAHHAAALRA